MRKCPLFNVQRALGAVFVEHAGFQVPAHYGDPETEYAAARQSCVVVDVSYHGKLCVGGPDRVALLDRLLSGGVAGIPTGRGRCVLALTPTGRILAAIRVYALEGWHLLELGPTAGHSVQGLLAANLGGRQVEVHDLTEAWGLLSLQGPQSRDALGYLGVGVPPPDHIGAGGLAGHPVLVAERRRAAAPGYDLFVAAPTLLDCWNSILERGVLPAGLTALNALRIEAGIPWPGAEVDGHASPAEVGDVDVQAAAGTHGGAPVRRLRGLVIDGGCVPSPGAAVWVGRRKAGTVTSAAFSHALGSAIALAYLRRGCFEPGQEVQVDLGGERRGGRVVELPFIRE